MFILFKLYPKSDEPDFEGEKFFFQIEYCILKRTCLQINTNTHEQITCEFHRVKKFIKENKHNRK